MRRNTLMSPTSVGHSGIWRQLFLLFAGVLMLGFFAPLAAQAQTSGTPGEIVIKDKTVSENVGTATVRVSLLHRVNHKVSVGYKTVNGTAIAGTDYTAVSGRLVFPKGAKVRHVSVPIINDTIVETPSTEFFKVRLFDAFKARIVDRTGIVTIIDDDVAPPEVLPALTVKDAQAQEGEPLVFQVSLDKVAKEAVTFDFATSDGTAKAPGDYTATSGKGTIAAGATSTTVTVPTTEDSTFEGKTPETMTLTITNVVGATVAHNSATGAIIDDDQPPTMNIKDPTVKEGSDAVFTVTLSKASEVPAKAEWATSDGTAKAPFDYTAASGVVTIQPGDTTAKISVETKHDFLFEPGPNEFFFVTLSSPHDAMLGMMHTAKAEIIDADHVPAASLTGGSADEGSGVPFKVSLAPRSTQSITFSWKVEIKTGDTATAADFPGGTLPSGTVTVPAYHDDASFLVPTFNDMLVEHNETFHVVLTGVSPMGAATLLAPSAQGTIVDHDHLPMISVTNAQGPEGTLLVFDVKLSAISGLPVTFNWKTVDGTAKAGVDYTAAHGSLTIPAGHLMEQIKVQTLDDLHNLGISKTFTVEITDIMNAMPTHLTGTGTVLEK